MFPWLLKPKKKPKSALGKPVAEVTHYFPKVGAGVLKVEKEIRVGDKVRFKGSTTDFKQIVKSMEINRIPIDFAKPGEEIGLEVKKRVRQGDRVFRLGE